MCGSAGGMSRNCATSRLFAAPVPGAFDHGKRRKPAFAGHGRRLGKRIFERSNAQKPTLNTFGRFEQFSTRSI